MKDHDVVILGLGVMGAAAAWRASLLGARVLAVEAGGPTHRFGSSHGGSRIFRRAYWEGGTYLELLALADRGWRELQAASRTRLLVETGGIFIGPKRTRIVAGSRTTAIQGGIAHERLDAAAVRRRFPQFRVDDDMEAIFEPGAYAVLADEARLRMLDEAAALGAEIRFGEGARLESGRDGEAVVVLRSGRAIKASAILVCAGAANRALLPELAFALKPNRVPIFWFDVRPGRENRFGPDDFPVFLYETKDGGLLYGVAAGVSAEKGVKIGFHNRQHVPFASGDDPLPPIEPPAREMESYLAEIFPDLVTAPIDGKWCGYTMTPDESFILDRSAVHLNVHHVNACSGHGFKFAPAIGHVMAEQALGLAPSADLAAFRLDRFDARVFAAARR